MAQLVIRVAAKPSTGNPENDARRSQPGDVIEVLPDGWVPSRSENKFIGSGDWGVVVVPGTVAEWEYLRDPQIDRDGKVLAKRRNRLDLVTAVMLGKTDYTREEIAAVRIDKAIR
ncbi:MAG: hypothetical protein A3E78_12110 [Alphaproteobacteria bacterium RIFCSPHIGHO2_12_FULL_63_12]|nr:MAG: hypothetical protein A3E78_12110 [Alphaproteobacteria bacterium RIFCSPHIGHO2_12_FULL_63_12]